MIVVLTGPMMLPGTVVRITKGGYRNDNQIKRPTHGMIVVPRPPVVCLQEDIQEQQLHGLRTEQLLSRLPVSCQCFADQRKKKPNR